MKKKEYSLIRKTLSSVLSSFEFNFLNSSEKEEELNDIILKIYSNYIRYRKKNQRIYH
jgi:hypothetical protein